MLRTESMTDAITNDLIEDYSGTPRLIVYWVILGAACIVFSIAAYFDLIGSIEGFNRLDIQHLHDWMPVIVGLMPQLVQFVLTSLVVRAIKLKARSVAIYGFVWFCAFFIDSYTDYIYFAETSQSFTGHITAIFMAVVVFTIFSDWFFALVLSLFLAATPDAIASFSSLFNTLGDRMGFGETNTGQNTANKMPKGEPKRERPPRR